MNVVIVESPAKAKTINKYLGDGYTVLASYGHIRDLPSKDGSVQPNEDFAMSWEMDAKSSKRMGELAKAVKGCDTLFLATDPDREGEAISWHVLEVLNKKKALKDVAVKRVAFNEITKSAILQAMSEPRDLDTALVDAYLARRALDYLVGFTLSPVLWRKLPGARSAGRVQSVALRLICDREWEIEAFNPQEYWSITTALKSAAGDTVSARLVALDGKPVKKHDINNETDALNAVAAIKSGDFRVSDVEKKPTKRNPYPPFTTSTLQQEAARKLGFSASRTMSTAQSLYEGKNIGGETTGLITYMRTDGVSMAGEAIAATRRLIAQSYGDKFVPDSPRMYKSKAKNAQEAHEAIRPTDLFRRPTDVAKALNEDERRLYDLIWKRTVASQMAQAQIEQTRVTFDNGGPATLRANGNVIMFEGFLKIYQESRDDGEEENEENRLPPLKEGEALECSEVAPKQHFTDPPPRFTEASLVKKLEELGIGRPSTYASILSVLRQRDYVHMDRNRFIPEDKGHIVIAFLENFFGRYVEFDFTAGLEEQLDKISAGEMDWKEALRAFWSDFEAKTSEVMEIRTRDILDTLNVALETHIFPMMEKGKDPRKCPTCADGVLSLKVSKFGAFVGCSNYPECAYTRKLSDGNGKEDSENPLANGPLVLCQDDETGLDITVREGRFGPYIQVGEQEKGTKEKPKRAGIPKDMTVADIDCDWAKKLLSLPREVGPHPETGNMITAAIGRYGPYVAHDGKYASLTSTEEVFSVGPNRAVAVLAEAKSKRGGSASELKDLGKHPTDGEAIKVMNGRYGPYVKHLKTNATLPRGTKPEDVTLEQAVELIAAKIAKGPAKKKAPAKKKKAPAKKKATPKKKTAKKKTE